MFFERVVYYIVKYYLRGVFSFVFVVRKVYFESIIMFGFIFGKEYVIFV